MPSRFDGERGRLLEQRSAETHLIEGGFGGPGLERHDGIGHHTDAALSPEEAAHGIEHADFGDYSVDDVMPRADFIQNASEVGTLENIHGLLLDDDLLGSGE